jgi:predicted nucleic acid-binding protein
VNGIILDTCLVSEPKRPRPNASVRVWFERQDPYHLYLTTMIVGELADGVARMPAGRGRSDHQAWLGALIDTEFAGRIFAFEIPTALLYGELVAGALAQGRPPQVADAQIAAVARERGMAVATRNVADFEAFGITIINPWQGASTAS